MSHSLGNFPVRPCKRENLSCTMKSRVRYNTSSAFALVLTLLSRFVVVESFPAHTPAFKPQRRIQHPYAIPARASYYSDDPYSESHGSERPYWEEQQDDFLTDDEDDIYSTIEKDTIDWEKCDTDAGTAWVLLPPPTVLQPVAVLHFCGGAFTGSKPKIFYNRLLQDLVRHTSCCVVASTIPISLARSPLNHVRLARQMEHQFRTACRDLLQDEYGLLDRVPVCAIGHSLGARLLTVLATLGPTPYKSAVWISFTNHGAAAGIPGLWQLYKNSRKVEEENPNRRKRRYRDDDDWNDLLSELADTVQAGTGFLRKALTPASSSLEFHPTPEQLWTAISKDCRYQIAKTLVVQFDDDPIDQSSKLASTIHELEGQDVKFCRLRGTHLTPVSFESSLLKQPARKQPSMLELRQSIARYITEVVTKE